MIPRRIAAEETNPSLGAVAVIGRTRASVDEGAAQAAAVLAFPHSVTGAARFLPIAVSLSGVAHGADLGSVPERSDPGGRPKRLT